MRKHWRFGKLKTSVEINFRSEHWTNKIWLKNFQKNKNKNKKLCKNLKIFSSLPKYLSNFFAKFFQFFSKFFLPNFVDPIFGSKIFSREFFSTYRVSNISAFLFTIQWANKGARQVQREKVSREGERREIRLPLPRHVRERKRGRKMGHTHLIFGSPLASSSSSSFVVSLQKDNDDDGDATNPLYGLEPPFSQPKRVGHFHCSASQEARKG